MKTTNTTVSILFAGLTCISLMSLSSNKPTELTSKESLGQHILSSINHQSFDELKQAVPTKQESFHYIEIVEPLFGGDSKTMKAEYEATYESEYLLKEEEAFNALLQKLNRMKVNSLNLRIHSVKITESATIGDVNIHSIAILVEDMSGEAQYFAFEIEQVMEVDGQWRFAHKIEVKPIIEIFPIYANK